MRLFILLVSLVILFLALNDISIFDVFDDFGNTTQNTEQEIYPEVNNIEKCSGNEICGLLTNKDNVTKSYTIKFPVYDVSGNRLGDAQASINNLNPGETWNFKAFYLGYFDSYGDLELYQ